MTHGALPSADDIVAGTYGIQGLLGRGGVGTVLTEGPLDANTLGHVGATGDTACAARAGEPGRGFLG